MHRYAEQNTNVKTESCNSSFTYCAIIRLNAPHGIQGIRRLYFLSFLFSSHFLECGNDQNIRTTQGGKQLKETKEDTSISLHPTCAAADQERSPMQKLFC